MAAAAAVVLGLAFYLPVYFDLSPLGIELRSFSCRNEALSYSRSDSLFYSPSVPKSNRGLTMS